MGKKKPNLIKNDGSGNPNEIKKKIDKNIESRKHHESALALNMNPTNDGLVATQGEKESSTDGVPGYIFLCNGRTKPECFTYRVFGLPGSSLDVVEKIKPNAKLFLFDFDLKLLYGVYSATSRGAMYMEPNAFGGRFPAQVKFEILMDCLPLPESVFKYVIQANYYGRSKFKQELNDEQVNNLIMLFRPMYAPSSAQVTSVSPNVVSSHDIQPSNIVEPRLVTAALPLQDVQPVNLLQLTDAGLALISKHNQLKALSSGYGSHSTTVDAISLQPGGSVPYSRSYYPAETNHPYYQENPASYRHDPYYSRYTMAPDNEVKNASQFNHAQDHHQYIAQTRAPPATWLQNPGSQSFTSHDRYYDNGPLQVRVTAPINQSYVARDRYYDNGLQPGHAAGVSSQVPNSSNIPKSAYFSAQYWAAVANEGSNQVETDPRVAPPSGNSGLEGNHVHASHQPTSLAAPYWAAMASDTPSQMTNDPYASVPSSSQPSEYHVTGAAPVYYNNHYQAS